MVVVVDVNFIVVPLPIAAAAEIVGSNDPIRVVVEHDAAGVTVNAARDENFADVLVAAVGISTTGLDAIVVGVPVGVRIVGIILDLVLAVVVALAIVIAVAVFVLTLVFAMVMTLVAVAAVVAILRQRGQRESACPGDEDDGGKEFCA